MNIKFGVKILSVFLMVGGMLFKVNDCSTVYAMKRGARIVPHEFAQIPRGGDTADSTDAFYDSWQAKLRSEWFMLLRLGDVPNLSDFLDRHGKQCVNLVDCNGVPSLHYAAMYGNEKAVKCLIDNGANINSLDVFGRTPLMCAVERFCGSEWLVAVGIMHTLCVSGANVNIKCAGGNTALHRISSVGNVAWRQIFLNMGGDDTIKNDAGFTPRQLFEKCKREKV